MLASKDKISTRQAVLLFFMMTVSPAIRIFPHFAAEYAGKAGWLAPIAGIIPMIFLVYLINSFFKNNKNADLSDIFCKVTGKIIGKIIAVLYLVWSLVLLSLYIRYYAERILSTMMPDTSIVFLICVMLAIVYIAVRSGLVKIARANEIFFGIFLIIFIILFILAAPQIKYRNYMNVSYKDALPAAEASIGFFSLWGYFIYVFFFGDKVNDKKKIKKFGFQILVLIFILSTLILILTIGAIGSSLTAHMSLPFFIVVKNISILGTIERIESVLLALWVISDFIIITMFTYISVSILKSTFNLTETKSLAGPVVLLAGIGACSFLRIGLSFKIFRMPSLYR
jgi:spore germination protein (amino acid permease)